MVSNNNGQVNDIESESKYSDLEDLMIILVRQTARDGKGHVATVDRVVLL